jgi:hypothetical protein
MNKRLASLLLASFVALGAAGSASAWSGVISFPGPISSPGPSAGQAAPSGGNVVEVGVAFNAFSKRTDPRAECEASGGSARRQIQADGTLAWICVR